MLVGNRSSQVHVCTVYFTYVMSFLRRLKKEHVVFDQTLPSTAAESSVAQLPVDIFQTANAVVIYALVPGATLSDIHISIEGDANIVLLEGVKTRPEQLTAITAEPGAYFTEECAWGEFYRRIILPDPIIVAEADAQVKDGVLIVTLPLVRPAPMTPAT